MARGAEGGVEGGERGGDGPFGPTVFRITEGMRN